VFLQSLSEVKASSFGAWNQQMTPLACQSDDFKQLSFSSAGADRLCPGALPKYNVVDSKKCAASGSRTSPSGRVTLFNGPLPLDRFSHSDRGSFQAGSSSFQASSASSMCETLSFDSL